MGLSQKTGNLGTRLKEKNKKVEAELIPLSYFGCKCAIFHYEETTGCIPQTEDGVVSSNVELTREHLSSAPWLEASIPGLHPIYIPISSSTGLQFLTYLDSVLLIF